jgi:hypothetical protein
MALRFQLLNANMTPLILEVADPIDINSLSQKVKRSDDNEGVIYEVVVDVEFIKDGRAFIKQAYELYGGIDAQVQVNIYERNPDLHKWELYFTGQIDYTDYELSEDKATVTIEQTGFQRRVLNLMDHDVDLQSTLSSGGVTLPSNPLIVAPLHSKTIRRQFQSSNEQEEVVYAEATGYATSEVRFRYFIPTFEPTGLSEIE